MKAARSNALPRWPRHARSENGSGVRRRRKWSLAPTAAAVILRVSNSQMLCEAWSSTKDILAQLRKELPEGHRFYDEGTTLPPYDENTWPLIRRLVWQRLKNTVLRRDRYRCQDCEVEFGARRRKIFDRRLRKGKGGYRWESLEVHHIIARSRGGSDHPGNLKTLCPACHRSYTSEQAVTRLAETRQRREALRSLEEGGHGDEVIEDPRD